MIVGVGVEPEHEERAADPGGMGGHPRDRPERERMIAAEEDRQALLHRLAPARGQGLGPGDGLGEVVDGRIGAGHVAQVGGRHVAPVLRRDAEVFEAARQARDAEGGRAHQAAVALLAAVDRGTDENRMGFHGNSCRLASGC